MYGILYGAQENKRNASMASMANIVSSVFLVIARFLLPGQHVLQRGDIETGSNLTFAQANCI